MKIKTSELIGAALDWAVAKCEGFKTHAAASIVIMGSCTPSTDWAQGGPIIDRERILTEPFSQTEWTATYKCPDQCYDGPTLLVAAMRCFVASALGDEVEIPDGLQGEQTS